MKVTHYQQMMAYLTRPGYDKGGKVLPKKKPQEEIKRRSRINYKKLKKYLDPESQMFIEKELGFAEGGGVNPLQLKQRFMQLVSSIQDAEPEEIPGIVAEAKQIKDQIDSLNQDLAPERQIKLTAEGLQFDNPLVDAVNIQRLVEPIQPVKKSIASLTEENPVLANVFKRSIEGLEDSEEKQAFMKASMKMDTGETFDKIKNIFKSAEPDSYPEIKTEDEFAIGGSVETPKRGLVDEPGSYAGLEKFEIEKINNPSDEALNEIRQIIDNLDIKQNNILGKEVRNLPKEITVEKLVKQIKTPGYKRPTIAKELLKRVLNEKNIKTYDNYRTEKIVTVLNNALDINKGDTLRIKPSAAVKLLPEFEVKNIKGGGGNSILKTYRNYIAGGERIGSRAGIPVPKEIGGRNLADIVTDLDRNFLDVTGGRSVGDMKILNEIKLLDRLANENPNVSATKLKELFEEAGGTNFQGRLVKIHPVKMGNLTEGDTGVILKQAAEEGVISNSMPDSLRKAIRRYSVDLNQNRFFKQAEKYRKSNPELAYEFTRAMNLISDTNMKKLGITGAGEHALPISAINTANAPKDIYFKIDAYVDHELNDWKSKNFDQPIFRKKGLAFKYNNADKLGLSAKQKLDIQEEIIQRLDFMKKKAPELMKNVTFDFSGGKFIANSSTPSILTLNEDGFRALNEKGNRINQKFITNMPDAVKLTSTGTIASIDDKFIRPKKPILDSLPSAVKKLPEATKIKICRRLAAKKLGGITQDCAVALKQNPTQTAGIVLDETKNLKTKSGVRASGLARNIIRLGIVSEAGFLAGEAAIGNIFSGRPFTESLQSTLFMSGKADAARERRAGLTTKEQMISDAIGLQGKIASLEFAIENAQIQGNEDFLPGLEKELRETKAELESPLDPTDRLQGTTLEDLTSPYDPTNISRQRKLDNILDADKTKSIASQMTLRDVEQGIPNIADYGEIDPGVSRKVFEPRKTLPADDDFFAEYLRKQLFQDAFSEKEFSVDPMDPTDKLKSDTIYDFLKEDITPMDKFFMKGSDPRFAEQIYGTQGKFAGGGIAKLAGVDSGPAPKSGPTPQGLDFLMKRGR